MNDAVGRGSFVSDALIVKESIHKSDLHVAFGVRLANQRSGTREMWQGPSRSLFFLWHIVYVDVLLQIVS